MLNSENPWTQIRARNNLEQAKIMLFDNSRSLSGDNYNQKGLALQSSNSALIQEAEQQVEQQQAAQQGELGDNRSRLNEYWGRQEVRRSKNVDSGLKGNFDAVEQEEKGKAAPAADAFNPSFLDQNNLKTLDDKSGQKGSETKAPGKPGADDGRAAGGRFYRGTSGKEGKSGEAGQQGQGQGKGDSQAPQLFNDAQKDTLQKKLKEEVSERDSRDQAGNKQQQDLSNYSQQLQQRSQQEQKLELGNNDYAPRPQTAQSMPQGQPAGGMGGGGGFGAQPGQSPTNGPMPTEPGRPMSGTEAA